MDVIETDGRSPGPCPLDLLHASIVSGPFPGLLRVVKDGFPRLLEAPAPRLTVAKEPPTKAGAGLIVCARGIAPRVQLRLDPAGEVFAAIDGIIELDELCAAFDPAELALLPVGIVDGAG